MIMQSLQKIALVEKFLSVIISLMTIPSPSPVVLVPGWP